MMRARINFAIFAAVTVGSGWLGVAVDRAGGLDLANGVALSNSSGTTGLAIFILLPALTAVVLYLVSRDGAGPLGFTLRFKHRAKWFAGAAAFYPLLTAICLGAGAVVGAVTLTGSPAVGKPTLVAAFATIFVIQLVKNLFEEFIFRGYGTRTAVAMGLRGTLTPHLLVGVVWALWHLPLYLVWTSRSDLRLISTLPLLAYLPMLIVGVTATSLVYGQMRISTGSIWPGVLLHSMCNAIATPLLVNGHVAFAGHSDAVFSPVPSSIIAMVLFAVAGLALIRLSGSREGLSGLRAGGTVPGQVDGHSAAALRQP